jgi:hypothetical protein
MSIWDNLETRISKGRWNRTSGSKKQDDIEHAARELKFFADEGGFTPKRKRRR